MILVSDYLHPTPHGGRCRVRIYEQSGQLPVVVCTEPKDNEGTSITNSVKQIAAEVLANHPDVFAIGLTSAPGIDYDKPFIWIEHYEDRARGTPEDPATFDLVDFGHYEPRDVLQAEVRSRVIGEPRWSPLDRATVETLVGVPLEG